MGLDRPDMDEFKSNPVPWVNKAPAGPLRPWSASAEWAKLFGDKSIPPVELPLDMAGEVAGIDVGVIILATEFFKAADSVWNKQNNTVDQSKSKKLK